MNTVINSINAMELNSINANIKAKAVLDLYNELTKINPALPAIGSTYTVDANGKFIKQATPTFAKLDKYYRTGKVKALIVNTKKDYSINLKKASERYFSFQLAMDFDWDSTLMESLVKNKYYCKGGEAYNNKGKNKNVAFTVKFNAKGNEATIIKEFVSTGYSSDHLESGLLQLAK